jgi:hypothetical protein
MRAASISRSAIVTKMSLGILPDWNSLDYLRRAHSDLEAGGLVFFALLVVMEALAHNSKDEYRKHVFDSIGIWFFAIAIFCEIGGYWYGQRNDELSQNAFNSLDSQVKEAKSNVAAAVDDSRAAVAQAKDALAKSGEAARNLGKAESEARGARVASANALNLAHGARTEADSFEKDIASAKQQAANAESHLAEALRQAAQAQAELNRIRSPRTIINEPALVASLTPFKGIEYTLNVFQDDESIQFTKDIGRVMDAGGWIRNQPKGMILGLTYLNVFDKGGALPTCVETGIQIHVKEKESFEALQLHPARDLPKTLLAAGALRAALIASVSPSDERNVGKSVWLDKDSGEGPVVICVGKKP